MLCVCCTQHASKFGKLSSGHRIGKGWFPFHSLRKAISRNVLTTTQLQSSAVVSHSSKEMLKILQARLQQYMYCEHPDVQAGFRKGRRIRDQIVNIWWIIKIASSSRKTSTSALLTMPKPLTVWFTANCGKF